jgi:SP family myo-inositol transporter-like MFS transporter 13
MITDVVFVIGELVMAATLNIPMLLGGRFIVGFAAGVMAMTGPNYLAEVAPNSHRGIMVGMNVVFIGAAQFLCYVLALALVPHWRVMLGLSVIFSVTQFVGMIYMPESPRWLFKVKKDQEAIAALTRIRLPAHKRDPQYIQEEITRMQFEQSSEISEPYFTQLKLLFTKYRAQITVGAALQIFQMLTGINNAMYYGPQIIIESGLASNKEMGLVYSLAFVGMLLVSATLGVVYSDRIGRRSILLWTLPGVSASMAGLAVIFYLMVYQNMTGTIAYFIVVIIVVYIAFYAGGIGPVPWTVNSEIYPNQLQSVASSVAATFNWVFNFIVSMTFLTLMSFNAGKVLAWALPAFFTALAWLFVFFKLPETKGKSLGEILELFKGKKVTSDSLI